MRDKNTPPSWFPNAIATKRGWEDGSTGEVLVSNRTLDLDLINGTKKEDVPVKETKAEPEDQTIDLAEVELARQAEEAKIAAEKEKAEKAEKAKIARAEKAKAKRDAAKAEKEAKIAAEIAAEQEKEENTVDSIEDAKE